MHLVDLATCMQHKAIGEAAQVVPFHLKNTKMTLYKGDAALDTRRAVASKLTPALITALQRPRRVDDKPNWAPMQRGRYGTSFVLARVWPAGSAPP